MNDRSGSEMPRFDEARSAAIRSALIEHVEQSPRHDRRRQIRVAVAAVLAALGVGLGGTAVAFALSGGLVFGDVALPAPSTTAAVPVATPSPTATDAPPTPTPHPLVVTDDPIVPHDVLVAPAAAPKWSLQLPGVVDMCAYESVIDVSDGYALIQVGPNLPPEDSAYDCDLDASRLSLTLVDTSTGAPVWSRDWSWEFNYSESTTATVLGTSGRVMLWNQFSDQSPPAQRGPREVLDLATGATLSSITVPDGYSVDRLYAVPGDSGDVSFVARKLDDAGQPTTTWAAMRADPQSLDTPRWSVPVEGDQVSTAPITNSSSIMQVSHYTAGQPADLLDVYDIDSGALMVGGTTDRDYTYFDGFTLRSSGFIDYQLYRTIAGVDDAGNEIWSRTLDSGYAVASVPLISTKSTVIQQPSSGLMLLIGPGTQLELIDGATGQSRWTADGSGCMNSLGVTVPAVSTFGWWLSADDVIVQYGDAGSRCGFDHATGASVDVSQRPSAWVGVQGLLAQYTLDGALGTGGLSSSKGQGLPPDPMPQSGVGTAYDAVTGAALWSIPAYYDERWAFAGGYLVGFSQGRVFGIG